MGRQAQEAGAKRMWCVLGEQMDLQVAAEELIEHPEAAPVRVQLWGAREPAVDELHGGHAAGVVGARVVQRNRARLPAVRADELGVLEGLVGGGGVAGDTPDSGGEERGQLRPAGRVCEHGLDPRRSLGEVRVVRRVRLEEIELVGRAQVARGCDEVELREVEEQLLARLPRAAQLRAAARRQREPQATGMRPRLDVVVEIGEERPELRLLRGQRRVRGAARAESERRLVVTHEPAQQQQVDGRGEGGWRHIRSGPMDGVQVVANRRQRVGPLAVVGRQHQLGGERARGVRVEARLGERRHEDEELALRVREQDGMRDGAK